MTSSDNPDQNPTYTWGRNNHDMTLIRADIFPTSDRDRELAGCIMYYVLEIKKFIWKCLLRPSLYLLSVKQANGDIQIPLGACMTIVYVWLRWLYVYKLEGTKRHRPRAHGHTVLSVNECTPFEKHHFKQYLNEHKNNLQNFEYI